jgi:hypothetical protein
VTIGVVVCSVVAVDDGVVVVRLMNGCSPPSPVTAPTSEGLNEVDRRPSVSEATARLD